MCTICGCGDTMTGSPARPPHHDHHDGHGDHARHDLWEGDDGALNFGAVPVPGMSARRLIRSERDILSKNNALAKANRARLLAAGQFALNLVSSPGSGKTSLLVRTVTDLRLRFAVGVVEGDQQTSNDAERIRAAGAPAVQINTGKGCHLDAHMVGHALDRLPLSSGGLLLIENVGNLVCPAAFDLGEARRVVVLSVTEGEDKPLKYPDIFSEAHLMLINKVDLLPHVDFDFSSCLDYARRVNPRIDILAVSARTGSGMEGFYEWIERSAAGIQPVAANAGAEAPTSISRRSAPTPTFVRQQPDAP